MHSLTKFDTEPPIWFLDVDGGGRLELTINLVIYEKKETSQVKKTEELLLLQ